MRFDIDKPRATAWVAALARREISALELTDAVIARIESRDGPINAVVVRDFDRAREQARAADALIAKGERWPLLGLPMTVKESFDVAGLATTWGFAQFKDYTPDTDAIAVQRLKQAGAVIVGKTNVPPGLGDWQTVNPVYGRTNNPLALERSPGGSSGGSAAALAAGLVPLEVGSDIGGSIRVPAHFCGLVGHKPTYGILAARGHKPPHANGAPSNLSVIGPLAHDAADATLAFDVLLGPDPLDAVGMSYAPPPPRCLTLDTARLLLIDTHPTCPTDHDTRNTLNTLAERLAKAGARVARTSPLLPDLAKATDVYSKVLFTEINRRSPSGPSSASANAWLAWMDERHRLRIQWSQLFRQFDAVITPAFGTPAFVQFQDDDVQGRQPIVDGGGPPYCAQIGWPGLATLPGLPATTVRAGSSREGLPIGVQIIGPWLEDRTPLALAAAIERLQA